MISRFGISCYQFVKRHNFIKNAFPYSKSETTRSDLHLWLTSPSSSFTCSHLRLSISRSFCLCIPHSLCCIICQRSLPLVFLPSFRRLNLFPPRFLPRPLLNFEFSWIRKAFGNFFGPRIKIGVLNRITSTQIECFEFWSPSFAISIVLWKYFHYSRGRRYRKRMRGNESNSWNITSHGTGHEGRGLFKHSTSHSNRHA